MSQEVESGGWMRDRTQSEVEAMETAEDLRRDDMLKLEAGPFKGPKRGLPIARQHEWKYGENSVVCIA